MTDDFSRLNLGTISINRVVEEAASRGTPSKTICHAVDETVSLGLPENWEVWEASEEHLFVAAAPEIGNDDIQPHISITREVSQSDSSLSDLVGNVLYLRGNVDGYAEREIIELQSGNQRIFGVIYELATDYGVFHKRQYFLALGGWSYLVTCTSLPEQAARWADAFDDIVRSIRIADGSRGLI